MISKLDIIRDSENCVNVFGDTRNVAGYKVINKVNELIDAVNGLQTKINKLAPTINFTQPKAKDKFAEQRKWIGKLCWFWDNEHGLKTTVGVLEEISTIGGEFPYLKKESHTVWKHCEPVKPDDYIIYKGDNNE